jgi:hypothetical protein
MTVGFLISLTGMDPEMLGNKAEKVMGPGDYRVIGRGVRAGTEPWQAPATNPQGGRELLSSTVIWWMWEKQNLRRRRKREQNRNQRSLRN